MSAPHVTYELAQAAATDAGNREAQGQPWTWQSYNAAVRELDRLYPLAAGDSTP